VSCFNLLAVLARFPHDEHLLIAKTRNKKQHLKVSNLVVTHRIALALLRALEERGFGAATGGGGGGGGGGGAGNGGAWIHLGGGVDGERLDRACHFKARHNNNINHNNKNNNNNNNTSSSDAANDAALAATVAAGGSLYEYVYGRVPPQTIQILDMECVSTLL
jgi:hypothetical protein